MYAVIVRFEVQPDKVDPFVSLARYNAEQTRKEPGNLQFDLLRSPENPLRFALVEMYRDEAAFKEHQKTAHYARYKDEVPGLLSGPRASEKYEVLTPERGK